MTLLGAWYDKIFLEIKIIKSTGTRFVPVEISTCSIILWRLFLHCFHSHWVGCVEMGAGRERGGWWGWWWREQRAGWYGILAQSSEDRCTLWLNRWFTEQCLQQLRGLIRDHVLHLRTSGEVFLFSSWCTAPLQVVGDVQ